MSDEQPEMVVQHLYEGKVFDIWAAWQSNEPENYVLGRSQLEVRENFAMRLEIVFEHVPGGIKASCARFKDLEGRGPSTMRAERDLIRKINLLSDKLDWREMFFELAVATGDAWRELPWHEREIQAVQRELAKRWQAAEWAKKIVVQGAVSGRFSGTGEPNQATLPKEDTRGYAETPFGKE
jgi:hypothetical protein